MLGSNWLHSLAVGDTERQDHSIGIRDRFKSENHSQLLEDDRRCCIAY